VQGANYTGTYVGFWDGIKLFRRYRQTGLEKELRTWKGVQQEPVEENLRRRLDSKAYAILRGSRKYQGTYVNLDIRIELFRKGDCSRSQSCQTPDSDLQTAAGIARMGNSLDGK